MAYYVYMIECENGTYYTGYTTDLMRRYEEHCAGSAKCKYTRAFPPKRLAASWEVEGDVSLAMKIECAIKALSKVDKRALVDSPASICSKITIASEVMALTPLR